MPSQEHEILLMPFRNRPMLAPEMLRDGFGVELPKFVTVGAASADLTQVEPTEYRADLVLHLRGAASDDNAVAGIIVEAQRFIDDDKRYSWPAYVANLRAKLRTPAAVTRNWCSKLPRQPSLPSRNLRTNVRSYTLTLYSASCPKRIGRSSDAWLRPTNTRAISPAS
ncbi:MAG: hypothetical protein LBE59_06175, partial [Nevskiaceae bacterium]|nr:hypothetical protein [Nevskiaceae bacterium]